MDFLRTAQDSPIENPNGLFNENLAICDYERALPLAYVFTQMAAKLTGALQLLPTNDYTHDPQQPPKTWLKLDHPTLQPDRPLDKLDIYDDIYKSERIGLLACKRYDPNGRPRPYTQEEFKRVSYQDWCTDGETKDVLLSEADPTEYQRQPHTIYIPARTPYSDDNYRLRGKGVQRVEDSIEGDTFQRKFFNNLDAAKSFHAKLRLQHHPQTFVVRSQGEETVVDTTLELDKHGVLLCPYQRSAAGDGTVPLTSAEALLQQGAQPAGPVITQGRVEHADICGNKDAVQQTLDSIQTLATTFATDSVTKP